MWLPLTVAVSLVSVMSAGLSPVYSPSYANVYYQGSSKSNSGTGVKEEVTDPPPNFDEVNPTLDPDTATEPYSENVNFTEVHQGKQGPKKIHEAIELSEELDPTDAPDLEPTDVSPVVEGQGVYYIYHPSGILQKVDFVTRDDIQRMEYVANVNYQNVEPIAEPIFIYDPDTLGFQRLQLDYV